MELLLSLASGCWKRLGNKPIPARKSVGCFRDLVWPIMNKKASCGERLDPTRLWLLITSNSLVFQNLARIEELKGRDDPVEAVKNGKETQVGLRFLIRASWTNEASSGRIQQRPTPQNTPFLILLTSSSSLGADNTGLPCSISGRPLLGLCPIFYWASTSPDSTQLGFIWARRTLREYPVFSDLDNS